MRYPRCRAQQGGVPPASGIGRDPSLLPLQGETRPPGAEKRGGIPALPDAKRKRTLSAWRGRPFCMENGVEPYWAGESRPHVGGGGCFPSPNVRAVFQAVNRGGVSGPPSLSGGLTALPCRRDCVRNNPHRVREVAVPVTGGLPEARFPVRRTMPRLLPKVPSLPERFWRHPPVFRSGAPQGWREGLRRPWRGLCRRG